MRTEGTHHLFSSEANHFDCQYIYFFCVNNIYYSIYTCPGSLKMESGSYKMVKSTQICFFFFPCCFIKCSLSESSVNGEQPPLSLSSADEGSWTQVEDYEAQPTLWVPDHAATNCAKCDTQFWIANRKHHCRYCERRHFVHWFQ